MPLAIFRITKVDGQSTPVTSDPFIEVGYYSLGRIGTPHYKNEPVHVLAAPRRTGYPVMRWVALTASRLPISAVLHTEYYDVHIEKGQFADFKTFGPAEAQVVTVTINVQTALNVSGGGMWSAMQQTKVAQEPAEEESLKDDVLKLRGRKLARRAAGWAWDQLWK